MNDDMTGGPVTRRQDRPKCGARKHDNSGDTCTLPAGWGTEHPGYGQCRRHMGNAPNNVLNARRAQAVEAAARFGVEVETTAEEALMRELRVSFGQVLFYEHQVQALSLDAHVHGMERITRTTRPDGEGTGTIQEDRQTVKSMPNIWVELLHRARVHHLEVAATIKRLGIEQARVDLAHEQVAMMHAVILVALQRLAGIRADDPRIAAELPLIIAEVVG